MNNPQAAKYPAGWSGDGRYLLYRTVAQGGDLWALPLTGDRRPFPVVETRFDETRGQFPPDGTRFLFNEVVQGESVNPLIVLLNWKPAVK